MFFDKLIIHDIEKEQFKNLFIHCGFDDFENRYKVLEAFLKIERHITSEELAVLLEKEGISLPVFFVAETLEIMCRLGFAQQRIFDMGNKLYEHLHIGSHHDHIICTICGRITEFENREIEKLQVQVAKLNGFHMLNHKMELYGICDACIKKRLPSFLIIYAKAGEKLIIDDFTGGIRCRSRLVSMGLKPGDIIEIVSNYNSGQIVIASQGKRYILGKGLSEKIRCKSLI